jgi:hypothetical protein
LGRGKEVILWFRPWRTISSSAAISSPNAATLMPRPLRRTATGARRRKYSSKRWSAPPSCAAERVVLREAWEKLGAAEGAADAFRSALSADPSDAQGAAAACVHCAHTLPQSYVARPPLGLATRRGIRPEAEDGSRRGKILSRRPLPESKGNLDSRAGQKTMARQGRAWRQGERARRKLVLNNTGQKWVGEARANARRLLRCRPSP